MKREMVMEEHEYMKAQADPLNPSESPFDPAVDYTILLIEDEARLRDVIRALLEKMGYSVLVASNGKESVEIAENYQGDIHLALLDINMPVMSGDRAFPLLKKARPHMKIVICTGNGYNGVCRNLLEAGAFSLLHKPVGVLELSREIQSALEPTGSLNN